jgi:hypothetical protein
MAGLCVWLASPTAGMQGTALVLAAALAPVPFLLPRAALVWTLPALAPLLGTVALAPAFVAVAAIASARAGVGSAWRRAALGALGFGWLAVVEALTRADLLFGIPDGTLARATWEGSATGAAADALAPLVSSPALAPAIVWAAFAALLPVLVRGRWPALDALGAAAWAAGLIAAHRGLGELLAATTILPDARGAVAGPVIGALAAVAVASLATVEREPRAAPAGAG